MSRPALKSVPLQGPALDRALKRLGELQHRQRELEEKAVPVLGAWLVAQALEARAFGAENAAHARWVTAKTRRQRAAAQRAVDLSRRTLQARRRALSSAIPALAIAVSDLNSTLLEMERHRRAIGVHHG